MCCNLQFVNVKSQSFPLTPPPLRPAATTAAPVWTESTGIAASALRGSPARTAGSVSVDL